MPRGQAPFPSKSAVDSGVADKSRPLGRGMYERSDTVDPAVSRSITEPLQMGKNRSSFRSNYPGPSDDQNVNFDRMGTATKTDHTNKSYMRK
jgi:hypothetical protein